VPDGTIDTVVMTWTLCSIADPLAALGEIRRVLTRDGQLIFIEHGRAPDAGVARWQDRLTPLWSRFTGGCHLNRPIEALLAEGGFAVPGIEKSYASGPRFGAYFYRGIARAVINRGESVAGARTDGGHHES
jgi:hypothetical protein